MKIYEKETHEARYMYIEYENGGSDLDEKLIDSLDSRSLLKPNSRDPEGFITRFDISQYETLQQYLINRKLSRSEMVGLLAQLKSVISVLEDHMLSDGNILLDPPHILIDSMNRKVRFLPVRKQDGEFTNRIRPLIEEMFLHADISHADALCFAAEMMKTVLRGNVHLHDLMQLIEHPCASRVYEEMNPVKTGGVTSRSQPPKVMDDQVTVLLNPEPETNTAGSFQGGKQETEDIPEENEKTGIRGLISGLGSKVKELMDRDE